MLSWCDRLMGLSSGLRILKRPDFLLGRRGGVAQTSSFFARIHVDLSFVLPLVWLGGQ